MIMTWRKTAIAAILVAFAIAVIAWQVLTDRDPLPDSGEKDIPAERPKKNNAARKPKKRVAKQNVKAGRAETNATSRVKRKIPYEPRMSEAAEQELETFKDELSDKGYAAARHLAVKILSDGEPEAKKDCLEQLKICGSCETLTDIVTCLADDNEDVRIAANEAVNFCLQQIESDGAKVLTIESIVSVKGALNPYTLDLVVGHLNAVQNQSEVAEMALRVIEKAPGRAAEEAMKEAFEFATGEKFTTVEAAHELINSRKAGNGGILEE